jgi:hypothetical protein
MEPGRDRIDLDVFVARVIASAGQAEVFSITAALPERPA